jgi:uncharacterized Zn finger protein
MNAMKIGKNFEMVVSGKYQSYRFATSLEQEFSEELKKDDVTLSSSDLFALAVELTFKDIERQAATDPDFETVWAVRSKDLAQARFLQNKTAGSKTVSVDK